MQNHNHPEFDKEFMDISWDKMRQQLNKELPVNKKRRGGVWWWWTGMVAGLLLGLGMMWLLLQPNQPIIGNLPVAMKSETTILDTKDPAIIKTEDTNVLLKEANTKTQIAPIVNPNQKSNSFKSELETVNERVSKSSNNPPIAQARNSTKLQEHSSDELEKQIIADIEPISELTQKDTNNSNAEMNHSDNHSSPQLERLTIDNFSFLPYLHIPKLESQNSLDEALTLQPLPIEVLQRPRFRYGVHLGINGNTALGYHLGVGTQWQGKGRWGWSAGLQYARRPVSNLDVLVRSEAVLVEEDTSFPMGGGEIDTEDTTGGTNMVTITSAVDTTYVTTFPAERHNFYELPIQLTYQLGTRWRLGVGARFSIRVENGHGEDALSFGSQEFTDSSSGHRVNEEVFNDIDYTYITNDYQIPSIKKWQISPTASLSYRLTSRWDIQAQYAYSQWVMANDAILQDEAFINSNGASLSKSNFSKLAKGSHEWQFTIRYFLR